MRCTHSERFVRYRLMLSIEAAEVSTQFGGVVISENVTEMKVFSSASMWRCMKPSLKNSHQLGVMWSTLFRLIICLIEWLVQNDHACTNEEISLFINGYVACERFLSRIESSLLSEIDSIVTQSLTYCWEPLAGTFL